MNPTTRYLLGLNLVLALCLVALEWNSDSSGWAFFDTAESDLEAEMELSPLHRDEDEVPMMIPTEPQDKTPPSQELNLVDEDVEIAPEIFESVAPKEEPKAEEKEELPEAVDMYDAPVDFRISTRRTLPITATWAQAGRIPALLPTPCAIRTAAITPT